MSWQINLLLRELRRERRAVQRNLDRPRLARGHQITIEIPALKGIAARGLGL